MKKPIQLIAIYPTGIIEEQGLDQTPTLEQLQKIVGGYIEIVPHWNTHEHKDCIVFCNENGKIQGLPVNPTATLLWYSIAGKLPDHLVGGIAIVVGPRHMLNDM